MRFGSTSTVAALSALTLVALAAPAGAVEPEPAPAQTTAPAADTAAGDTATTDDDAATQDATPTPVPTATPAPVETAPTETPAPESTAPEATAPESAAPTDGPFAGLPVPADLDTLAQQLLTIDPAVHAVVPRDGGAVVLYVTASDLGPDTVAYAERHGGEVVVEDIGAPFTTQAAGELVGGAGYQFRLDDTTNVICSIGFTAWTPEGGDAVLTAGHCAEGRTDLTAELTVPSLETRDSATAWGPLGALGFAQFGQPGVPEGAAELDSVDIAAIDVAADAGLTLLPAVTDWVTASFDDLAASSTPIVRLGEAQPGQAVSASGRTSGLVSGVVVDGLGWASVLGPYGPTLVHGFPTTLATQPGDSGGAVFSGDTALGLISGGNTNMTLSWVADLGNALAQTGGYSLRLDLAEPAVTAPADLAVVPAASEITGTAHPSTTLTVAFGDRTQQVPVGADGTWSWTAPAEPGEYTLRLSVRDGGYNVSETVEVPITVWAVAAETPAPESPAPSPSAAAPAAVAEPACVPGVDCLAESGVDPSATLAAAAALIGLAIPFLAVGRRSRATR